MVVWQWANFAHETTIGFENHICYHVVTGYDRSNITLLSMSALLHLIVMQKSMTKASNPVLYHPRVVDLDHVLRRENLASVALCFNDTKQTIAHLSIFYSISTIPFSFQFWVVRDINRRN